MFGNLKQFGYYVLALSAVFLYSFVARGSARGRVTVCKGYDSAFFGSWLLRMLLRFLS